MGEKNQKKMIKLSLADFFFLVLEDIMPSGGRVITLRFKEKQSVQQIRSALRYMLSIYPRLRSVVEPTLFAYKLRILDDDDDTLDLLLDNEFIVKSNMQHGTEEYLECRRTLLNEPFSLEQGLPLKARFIPDDPKPILLLSIHHIICDGMSWIHLANNLLDYLNGKSPPWVPLSNPSFTPALLKRPYYKAPFQIFKSFWKYRADSKKLKKGAIINASSRPADFFGPVGEHQHVISQDLEAIKLKSKELDCSITVLFLTVLSTTISQMSPRKPGDQIGLYLPINMRPYYDTTPPVFGNYASNFTIAVPCEYQDTPKQLIEVIKDRLDHKIGRFKNKEIIFQYMINKLLTVVGRKNAARLARNRKGYVKITCAFSSLGNMDSLNSDPSRPQLCEAISIAPIQGIVMGISSLDGLIHSNLSYAEAEFTLDEIKNFIHSFEQNLSELLRL